MAHTPGPCRPADHDWRMPSDSIALTADGRTRVCGTKFAPWVNWTRLFFAAHTPEPMRCVGGRIHVVTSPRPQGGAWVRAPESVAPSNFPSVDPRPHRRG